MASIITTEGLDFAARKVLKDQTWYVAPFEGDYTPTPGLTAANFPATATECTAYEGTSRPEFVESDPVAGSVNNNADVIEFVLTADKTIYGFALLSSPAKGGTGGACLGAVRLSSPLTKVAGDMVRVRLSGFFVSAS